MSRNPDRADSRHFEALEERRLLATFTVTSADDTGAGSLRQAVADANSAPGADVIEFDGSLDGATIGLTSGEVAIAGDLTIAGLGEDRLTISGQRISRVFGIGANANVSMSDLTIKWGQQDNGLGGQIYVDQGASLTLTSVTLHDSQALWGGAIYNNFGSVTLIGSTVSEGKAFRHGGGIDSNGLLTIIDSSFVSNYATYDGGAVHGSGGYDGVTDISGSTFWNNVAQGNGGAITNLATMVITNSTISGNRAAGVGGAIYNWYTLSLNIYNSTIVENTAPDTGGIANIGTTATLTSTILSLNPGGDHSPGTVGGSNNYLGGDPLLGPLADNGGPTQTRAVLQGSPAIGQGSNPLGLTYDQRGAPYSRAVHGAVDIGAFQLQPLVLVVDSAADIENGDYSAGDLSLREAISRANASPLADSITFDAALSGQTITLGGTQLEIAGDLTITGPGADLLAVSGNDASRVLLIQSGASVSISGLTITRGLSDYGGGILNGGSLHLTDTTLFSNVSTGAGGAIADDGTLILERSTISGNTAAETGGIISSAPVLEIIDSTISGNTSQNSGGAITFGNELRLRNSTVAANNSVGIMCWGTMTVHNSTIAGNTGVGVWSSAEGAAVLVSSIVAGNAGGDVGATLGAGSTHNLIGDANTAGGLSNGVDGNLVGADPLLGPLADNGGPTLTQALPEGSPAIDAGTNPLGLANDQRGPGFARMIGTAVDIGATEAATQPLDLVVDNVEADVDDGNYTAGNLTLREAINRANASLAADSISFHPTLGGRTITLGGAQLEITDDLTITGLEGDLITISAEGASRIFAIDDGDSGDAIVVTISNLRLTAGSARDGGALFNAESLTLDKVTIADSTTEGDGGAIYNSATGSLTIRSSTLTGNQAAQHGADGGAIFNEGALSIESSTIADNKSLGGDDNVGGGIYNGVDATLSVTGSTLSDNWTVAAGGAIANLGAVTIRNSTLSGNESFGGTGGAIDNLGGVLEISGSTLSGNHAGDSGGAIWSDATLTITNSTISGNRANGWGGGIGMFDGAVVISNSTLAYNQADADGDGTGQGGAIDVGRRSGPGTLTTNSTIYAYNSLGSGSTVPNHITLTDGSITPGSASNLVADASTAGGLVNGVDGNIIGQDPLLGPLADNGGPTLTHALLAASPAVDAGANPLGLTTDQRGLDRTHGKATDIGALERQPGGGGGDEFSLRVGASSRIGGSATVDDTHYVAFRNTDGELILMIGSGSSWQAVKLSGADGSDRATDSPIVWVESGSIVWIGDPTAGGFRMWRLVGGSWSPIVFKQPGLTISKSPTQFTTRPAGATGKMYVAGLTASGDVVAYRQTDGVDVNGWIWEGFNISDDLRAQGMTTPAFNQLVSYVTPWNQWTVAGLDPSGDVQGVWIMANRFKRWRVDNLSDITGASPIAGQLTITQTSWSAINIGGVDTRGHVVVSWWVPGAGGKWAKNDLTDASGGSPLAGGKVAGFITPWGAINYAGLAADGNVTAYWWTPATQRWQEAKLTSGGDDRPTGEFTSYVSSAGTITILGVASDAALVRLAWTPDTDNRWNLLDLTEIAGV